MVTKEQVMKALKGVEDPELRMDIVTLGLVYNIEVTGEDVKIDMTFTTPMCPYGPALADEVKAAAASLKGVKTVEVEIVWDPPWKPPEEVLATLGL